MAPKTDEKYLHKTSERDKRKAKRKQQRKWRDIRRRVGGCVFMLGLPLLIAGGIILIVNNTNQDNSQLPPALDILGPLLTSMAFVCFIIGAFLTEFISCTPFINCIVPNDTKKCPTLFKLFRGHEQSYIDQQAALKSLQSVPQKSALRKPLNPDAVEPDPAPKSRRGVTFSESDADDALIRNPSSSSDQPEHQLEVNKNNSSALSLRNCKIYPRETETGSRKNKDNSAVYTVSRTYFDIPVSTKTDDDVFYNTEELV
ncbi:hypothetical protein SNE40_018966 [Patella caerulea]|uniref:Uncharacterized protein n=1 Tax=Patella caerulea TaxID=87958 RepID=A0AAN8J5U4_PATCE